MPLMLVSTAGDRRFPLEGRPLLIAGRELTSDLPVLDAAVSRRHAELRPVGEAVEITDLGSRNGTWLNGTRIERGVARDGDRLAFGTVTFLVRTADALQLRRPPSAPPADSATTRSRERAMPSRAQALADIAHVASAASVGVRDIAARSAPQAQAATRLAQLVDIAQSLGGSGDLELLLDAITSNLFATLDADRVTILLRGETDLLETRVSRDRHGAIPRAVPRAIANGVAERQVALLTNDAATDARTAGASVLQQSVKSAMAAPLVGEGAVTLGVLYVDHLRERDVYTDDDLAFLVAFAGIAAAAVERERTTTRLRLAHRVRENFERYFTPHIAERIASATDREVPGGTRQRVVVLFSDIRGFTAIAEQLPPTAMAAQLNEYFSAMVDCLFRHDGALDKFIGDAIMAYWGAPMATDDDADKAVDAALDMHRALDALNVRWSAVGKPTLHAGIGVHGGDAFVGNIGSPRRLEYTLIGDTVNVANRVCSLAVGGEVLISETVRDLLTVPRTCLPRPELLLERRSAPLQHLWQIRPNHA